MAGGHQDEGVRPCHLQGEKLELYLTNAKCTEAAKLILQDLSGVPRLQAFQDYQPLLNLRVFLKRVFISSTPQPAANICGIQITIFCIILVDYIVDIEKTQRVGHLKEIKNEKVQ